MADNGAMKLVYDNAAVTVAAAARNGDDAARLDQLATDNAKIPNLGSCQQAFVQAILSDAGAHVDVAVILYKGDGTLLGLAAPGVQRATASRYTADNDAADYYAPILGFDLAGAASYEVRSEDASAGTRTLKTWAA